MGAVATVSVLMAFVAACTSIAGPERDRRGKAAPTTSPVPRLRTILPSQDFGTLSVGGRRQATGHRSPELELGFHFSDASHPGPAILRFAIESSSRCVAHASLRVTFVRRPTGEVPLAVYPIEPASLPAAEGDMPFEGALLDSRPRGVFEFAGRIGTADVTDLVRTWLAGGPFPSTGRRVAATSQLAIAVQPEAALSAATVRMFTAEAGPNLTPSLLLETTC